MCPLLIDYSKYCMMNYMSWLTLSLRVILGYFISFLLTLLFRDFIGFVGNRHCLTYCVTWKTNSVSKICLPNRSDVFRSQSYFFWIGDPFRLNIGLANYFLSTYVYIIYIFPLNILSKNGEIRNLYFPESRSVIFKTKRFPVYIWQSIDILLIFITILVFYVKIDTQVI